MKEILIGVVATVVGFGIGVATAYITGFPAHNDLRLHCAAALDAADSIIEANTTVHVQTSRVIDSIPTMLIATANRDARLLASTVPDLEALTAVTEDAILTVEASNYTDLAKECRG